MEDSRHRTRTYAEALLLESGQPGAALALIRDGEMVLCAGAGHTTRTGTRPMHEDATFYIYSITKTLLAAIVLRLAEQGILGIHATVTTFLPGMQIDDRITVRHLLNHTAGLPDYGTLPAYFAAVREAPSTPWSTGELLERTLAQGALFEPGEGWQYSNIGYLIVKVLIERLTGLSLRGAVDAHIVQPLGLRSTRVAEPLADAAGLTPGWSAFLGGDGEPVDATLVYHPGWVSHGVVISTAAETALMLDALAAGRLLEPESLDSMLTPVVLPFEHPLFHKPAYGLGVMIDAASPHGTVFGHGGSGPGYSLGALHVTNSAGGRVTSVALVNSDARDTGLEMALQMAELMATQPEG